MKMILAVIQERDVDPALDALRERKFGVTQIASTGGFWREGNVTLLVGAAEQRVEEAVSLLRELCYKRGELKVAPLPSVAGCVAPGSWYETEVGGAAVFIFNLERFEQL